MDDLGELHNSLQSITIWEGCIFLDIGIAWLYTITVQSKIYLIGCEAI